MKALKRLMIVSSGLLATACNPGFVSQLNPVKSTLSDWQKSDTSLLQKQQDLTACGGFLEDNYGPSKQQLELERRPGEVDTRAARVRLGWQTESCMLGKNYQYVGACAGDYRYRPACGAH